MSRIKISCLLFIIALFHLSLCCIGVEAQSDLEQGQSQLDYAIEHWSERNERISALNSAQKFFIKTQTRSVNLNETLIGLTETYYRLGLHYHDSQVNNPQLARQNYQSAITIATQYIDNVPQPPGGTRGYQFRFLARYKLAPLSISLLLSDLSHFKSIHNYDAQFNEVCNEIWDYIKKNYKGKRLCELSSDGLLELIHIKAPYCSTAFSAYCDAQNFDTNRIDDKIRRIYPVLQTDCSLLKDDIRKLYHGLLFNKANQLIMNDDFGGASDTLKKLFDKTPSYLDSIIYWPSHLEFREGYPIVELYLDNHKLPGNIKSWLTIISNDTSRGDRFDAKFVLLLFKTNLIIVREDFKDILVKYPSFRPGYFNTKNFQSTWQLLAETCYDINQENQKKEKDCVSEIHQLGTDICDSIKAQCGEDSITKNLRLRLSNQCKRSTLCVFLFTVIAVILMVILIITIRKFWDELKYRFYCLIMYDFVNLLTPRKKEYINETGESLYKSIEKWNNLDKNKKPKLEDSIKEKKIYFYKKFYSEIFEEIKICIETSKRSSPVIWDTFCITPDSDEKNLLIVFDRFPAIKMIERWWYKVRFRVNEGDFYWKRESIYLIQGKLFINLKLNGGK